MQGKNYTLKILENKIDELIRISENQIIKSITGHDYYLNTFLVISSQKFYKFYSLFHFKLLRNCY